MISSSSNGVTLTTEVDERFELVKAVLPVVTDKAGKNDTPQDIASKAIAIADAVLAEY